MRGSRIRCRVSGEEKTETETWPGMLTPGIGYLSMLFLYLYLFLTKGMKRTGNSSLHPQLFQRSVDQHRRPDDRP